MLFSRSGFDVSRASWEFPEGTCAGYNGEQRMMFLIMMTKTRMLMMSMSIVHDGDDDHDDADPGSDP